MRQGKPHRGRPSPSARRYQRPARVDRADRQARCLPGRDKGRPRWALPPVAERVARSGDRQTCRYCPGYFAEPGGK